MTAAHCVAGLRPARLAVVGGKLDLTTASNIYTVDRIVRQGYNDITKRDDIALLQLRPGRGTGLGAVPLCSPGFQPAGRLCSVSGWGRTSAQGGPATPARLQRAAVRVRPGKECGNLLAGLPWDSKSSTMICAGGGTRDACQVRNYPCVSSEVECEGGQRGSSGVQGGGRGGPLLGRLGKLC